MAAQYKIMNVFLLSLLLLILYTFLNSANYVDGHGLSRDESPPFDISNRQISVEGILEPSFLNKSINQNPSLLIRTFDIHTNETLSDINYRILTKFENQTILDQRFHSLDGIILVNLVPSNESAMHEIIPTQNKQPHLLDDDSVVVSSKNPVTIKSKILLDGGLYNIIVILEKISKGITIETDKQVDLYISVGKTFSLSTKDLLTNINTTENILLQVKTFYDKIEDLFYDQQQSLIYFKMPFKWDLDYVSQILTLHQELVIPKSFTPLSKASSFTGTLNGMEIPKNTIIIDDYSDPKNRVVHIVITSFQLKEYVKQIIKEGGSNHVFFELKAIHP